MKNIIKFLNYILLILIFISCNETSNKILENEKNIVLQKIEQNKIEAEFLKQKNSVEYNIFLKASEKINSQIENLYQLIEDKKISDLKTNIIEFKKNIYSFTYKKDTLFKKIINLRLEKWLDNEIKWDNDENIIQFKWDLLNIKNEINQFLLNSAEQSSYRFNRIFPVVYDSTDNLKVGDIYSAQIFFVALDTNKLPRLNIRYIDEDMNKNKYQITDNFGLINVVRKKILKSGKDSIQGELYINRNLGEKVCYYFSHEFNVKK